MPELIRICQSQFNSLIWEINETSEELFQEIQLSKSEIEMYQHLKTETRRRQWLAYRLALMVLNNGVHYPISYDEFGRPYYENGRAQISVSHSGGFAQAIISENIPVGVDVEVFSETAYRVQKKFMSIDEIAFGNSVDAKRISLYAWCAKEAIYKAMGLQGVIFANDILLSEFNLVEKRAKGLFRFNEIVASFELLFHEQSNFVSAMCWKTI